MLKNPLPLFGDDPLSLEDEPLESDFLEGDAPSPPSPMLVSDIDVFESQLLLDGSIGEQDDFFDPGPLLGDDDENAFSDFPLSREFQDYYPALVTGAISNSSNQSNSSEEGFLSLSESDNVFSSDNEDSNVPSVLNNYEFLFSEQNALLVRAKDNGDDDDNADADDELIKERTPETTDTFQTILFDALDELGNAKLVEQQVAETAKKVIRQKWSTILGYINKKVPNPNFRRYITTNRAIASALQTVWLNVSGMLGIEQPSVLQRRRRAPQDHPEREMPQEHNSSFIPQAQSSSTNSPSAQEDEDLEQNRPIKGSESEYFAKFKKKVYAEMDKYGSTYQFPSKKRRQLQTLFSDSFSHGKLQISSASAFKRLPAKLQKFIDKEWNNPDLQDHLTFNRDCREKKIWLKCFHNFKKCFHNFKKEVYVEMDKYGSTYQFPSKKRRQLQRLFSNSFSHGGVQISSAPAFMSLPAKLQKFIEKKWNNPVLQGYLERNRYWKQRERISRAPKSRQKKSRTHRPREVSDSDQQTVSEEEYQSNFSLDEEEDEAELQQLRQRHDQLLAAIGKSQIGKAIGIWNNSSALRACYKWDCNTYNSLEITDPDRRELLYLAATNRADNSITKDMWDSQKVITGTKEQRLKIIKSLLYNGHAGIIADLITGGLVEYYLNKSSDQPQAIQDVLSTPYQSITIALHKSEALKPCLDFLKTYDQDKYRDVCGLLIKHILDAYREPWTLELLLENPGVYALFFNANVPESSQAIHSTICTEVKKLQLLQLRTAKTNLLAALNDPQRAAEAIGIWNSNRELRACYNWNSPPNNPLGINDTDRREFLYLAATKNVDPIVEFMWNSQKVIPRQGVKKDEILKRLEQLLSTRNTKIINDLAAKGLLADYVKNHPIRHQAINNISSTQCPSALTFLQNLEIAKNLLLQKTFQSDQKSVCDDDEPEDLYRNEEDVVSSEIEEKNLTYSPKSEWQTQFEKFTSQSQKLIRKVFEGRTSAPGFLASLGWRVDGTSDYNKIALGIYCYYQSKNITRKNPIKSMRDPENRYYFVTSEQQVKKYLDYKEGRYKAEQEKQSLIERLTFQSPQYIQNVFKRRTFDPAFLDFLEWNMNGTPDYNKIACEIFCYYTTITGYAHNFKGSSNSDLTTILNTEIVRATTSNCEHIQITDENLPKTIMHQRNTYYFVTSEQQVKKYLDYKEGMYKAKQEKQSLIERLTFQSPQYIQNVFKRRMFDPAFLDFLEWNMNGTPDYNKIACKIYHYHYGHNKKITGEKSPEKMKHQKNTYYFVTSEQQVKKYLDYKEGQFAYNNANKFFIQEMKKILSWRAQKAFYNSTPLFKDKQNRKQKRVEMLKAIGQLAHEKNLTPPPIIHAPTNANDELYYFPRPEHVTQILAPLIAEFNRSRNSDSNSKKTGKKRKRKGSSENNDEQQLLPPAKRTKRTNKTEETKETRYSSKLFQPKSPPKSPPEIKGAKSNEKSNRPIRNRSKGNSVAPNNYG